MFGDWKALEDALEQMEEIKQGVTPSNAHIVGTVKGSHDSLEIYLKQQSKRMIALEMKLESLEHMIKFDQVVFARILGEVKKNQRLLRELTHGGRVGRPALPVHEEAPDAEAGPAPEKPGRAEDVAPRPGAPADADASA